VEKNIANRRRIYAYIIDFVQHHTIWR